MALCAGLWTASTYYILPHFNSDPSEYLIALTGFGTLLLYNLARLPFWQRGDFTGTSDSQSWMNKHKNFIFTLIIISFIGSFSAFILLDTKKLWPLFIAVGLVIAYYAPVFVNAPFGLRMFGTTKNLVIGLVWSILTVLQPVALTDGATIWSQKVLWLFTERTLFIYILMLPFDLEDVDQDAVEGVQTIPRWYGLTYTKRLMTILVLLLVGLQLWNYQGKLLIGQLFVSAYLMGLLFSLKPERSDIHFLAFWDGAIALQALGILLLDGGLLC